MSLAKSFVRIDGPRSRTLAVVVNDSILTSPPGALRRISSGSLPRPVVDRTVIADRHGWALVPRPRYVIDGCCFAGTDWLRALSA